MSGVFVGRGVQLRIPAGGLRIVLDGPQPPVVVELGFDPWHHWLGIARSATREAERARIELEAAHASGDSDAIGKALEAEFRASLMAISALGFCVDAFYNAVSARLPRNEQLERAWTRNRTARYKRIAETFRVAFRIRPAGHRQVREALRELFRFRDWAVHPPSAFAAPVLHPVLNSGVVWWYIAFSTENSGNALAKVTSLLEQLLTLRERSVPELREWGESANTFLGQTLVA